MHPEWMLLIQNERTCWNYKQSNELGGWTCGTEVLQRKVINEREIGETNRIWLMTVEIGVSRENVNSVKKRKV